MNEDQMEWWDFTKQSPIVEQAVTYLADNERGVALDLGSGEGRNARFLVELGFKVVAVDHDAKSLEVLKKICPGVKTVESSVVDVSGSDKYQLIVCNMVLHFLSAREVRTTINNMQEATISGGINAVSVYTNKNPLGHRPYQFATNELKDLYGGWEILSYEERPTLWFRMPGEVKPRRNQAAYLIARKKGV